MVAVADKEWGRDRLALPLEGELRRRVEEDRDGWADMVRGLPKVACSQHATLEQAFLPPQEETAGLSELAGSQAPFT